MNDQDLGLAAFWDKEGRFASFPPRVSRRMSGQKIAGAFPSFQSRGWFLEGSFKADMQGPFREVGALGKAPSTLLLKCPLATEVGR